VVEDREDAVAAVVVGVRGLLDAEVESQKIDVAAGLVCYAVEAGSNRWR